MFYYYADLCVQLAVAYMWVDMWGGSTCVITVYTLPGTYACGEAHV